MPDPSRSIRVAVVDDEVLARRGIIALLAKDASIEIAGEFGDGMSAVEGVTRDPPDILFLDVQMPELNGFEVLSLLDVPRMPVIVFVTAYDEFAVKAFEVHAFDYLLKPFTDERFASAVRRAKERVREQGQHGLGQQLLALLGSNGIYPAGQIDSQEPTRLVVREAGRVRFVVVADIDWIEGADYYARVHSKGTSVLLRESLSSLEARLDATKFFRAHRSAIINLSKVRELRTDGRADYTVVLEEGTRVKLSRGRRPALEALLSRLTSTL